MVRQILGGTASGLGPHVVTGGGRRGRSGKWSGKPFVCKFVCNGDFYAPHHLSKPTDLQTLCKLAIKENAHRLLNSTDHASGFSALHSLTDDLSNWAESDDWQWNCRFAYQTIEKRGTGGSGFRKMYARFLAEAGQHLESIKTLELEKFLVNQIIIDDNFDDYSYLLIYLIFDIYLRAKIEKINFLDQPAVEVLKKNTRA